MLLLTLVLSGSASAQYTYQVKDDISGYRSTDLYLRDPQGVRHHFRHYDQDLYKIYFSRNPTIYQDCQQTIILPVGSIPGTWGLAEMKVYDKASNILRADFTEIIRFEVGDTPISADFDGDGHLQTLWLLRVRLGPVRDKRTSIQNLTSTATERSAFPISSFLSILLANPSMDNPFALSSSL